MRTRDWNGYTPDETPDLAGDAPDAPGAEVIKSAVELGMCFARIEAKLDRLLSVLDTEDAT